MLERKGGSRTFGRYRGEGKVTAAVVASVCIDWGLGWKGRVSGGASGPSAVAISKNLNRALFHCLKIRMGHGSIPLLCPGGSALVMRYPTSD